MKILINSDIHTEFMNDNGAEFAKTMPDADVCLLAGDIGVTRLTQFLEILCQKYPQVIYVAGNHDYWTHSPMAFQDQMRTLENKCSNLHWLDNQFVTIDNQRLFGGTLWFPENPFSVIHQKRMPDFHKIRDFSPWVYKQNKKFIVEAEQVNDNDIVISHHLPSDFCIDPNYQGSPLNDFFNGKVPDPIVYKPKLWVYGHTHTSMDLIRGSTRFICNPYGYHNHELNKNWNSAKMVEV